MDGNSLDIKQEKINKLKELMPEVFTEGDKLDVEKLKLTLGEDINTANERYVLNWAGKSEAFKVLQTPTTATLKPCPGEGINDGFLPSPSGEGLGPKDSFGGVRAENIFIEGENLEVLKILQKSYYGKIKMIYIDPPYNTGNDSFIYPDKFSETKAEYLKRIGDKDEEGFLLKEGMYRKNSKDNGHYHSNWLNMMYPRLFLARNLMRDDGAIFVSIDDNEASNLKLMLNEVFGEENFLAQIVWQRSYAPISLKKYFSEMHDYVLVYAKNINNFKLNPLPRTEKQDKDYKNHDNDPRGVWKEGNLAVGPRNEKQVYEIITPSGRKVMPPKGYCWRYSKDRFKELLEDNRIWFGKNGDRVPAPKIFLKEVKQGVTPTTWWTHEEAGHNQESMRELREILKGVFFENPKPTRLLTRILNLATNANESDLVLDFFAGSGTIAQAVLELNKEDGGNRKFILVQLPELTDEKSEAYKAGYKTIADICKERIRRVIKNLTPQSPLQMERGRGRGGNSTQNLFKGAVSTLFDNAHQLRLVDKTKAEEILWQELRNRKVENCKFRRQHPIGKFIADFYCHEKKLVIEVDGDYHNKEEQKEYDEARTQVINEYGITVIRFTNDEVLNNIQSVLNKIRQTLNITTVDNSPLSTWRGAGGEVGFKVFKLKHSNFKLWRGDVIENGDDLTEQIGVFENPLKEGTEEENILYELLLKSGYELTTKIEQKDNIYLVADGELIVALTKIDDSIIKQIIKLKPQKCIMLDKLFNENDQLKTNTVLQMKDANIEFKTI